MQGRESTVSRFQVQQRWPGPPDTESQPPPGLASPSWAQCQPGNQANSELSTETGSVQAGSGGEECVVEMPRPPITGSGSPNLGCLEAVYDEPALAALAALARNVSLP